MSREDMTQEEVLALSGTKKVYSCDCCDSNDVEVTAIRVPKNPSRPMDSDQEIAWYCDLCSGTMASAWFRSGRPEGYVLSGVAYMVNTLLKALKNRVAEDGV
jgi:hypothetical protein